MDSAYDVQQVTKVYKKGTVKANDDISFAVKRGEIMGVLGPNGAGKSTLWAISKVWWIGGFGLRPLQHLVNDL